MSKLLFQCRVCRSPISVDNLDFDPNYCEGCVGYMHSHSLSPDEYFAFYWKIYGSRARARA